MNGSNGGPKPKVLIIGIDGATFDLIKPWAEEGKLPTFKRLLDEGVNGDLESVIPPITPPAWTSFMTGMNPGKHGLFNFIEQDPHDQSIRYTNASSRRAPTVWSWLGKMGLRVGVVNVPMTYPPEAVNGFCISGLDTPDESSKFVYPDGLKQELEQAVGKIYLDPRHLGYMTTDDKRDSVLDDLVKIENRRTDMAEYLITRHPTDVMMLVYTATDTVQHFFWHYMDPTHPFYDPLGAEKYRDAILDIHRMIDANIARLLARVPEETVVIVMSDHGGGPVSKPVIRLNQCLEELGVLAYKRGWNGRGSRSLHRLTRRLDDSLRGMLSPNQKARLAGMFPALRARWESSASSAALIDWEKTQAYCQEFLSFPSEIWINLEGKSPHGLVKPGAEYEAVVESLTRRLYELKDGETGRRLIRKIYRKDEVYRGPYLDLAPDLILSWWDAEAFQVQKSVPGSGLPSVGDGSAEPRASAASWSGTHRLHGVLIMKGGPLRRAAALSKAHITDVAPTLLHLMGVPVPPEMDGSVLLEAFEEEFTEAHRVQYGAGREPAHSVNGSGSAYTAAEAERIKERLKGLGYIE